MKNILIATAERAVWFAQVEEDADLTPTTLTNLKNARTAIYFGTERGIAQLAETGPTSKSRISAPADIDVIHNVNLVLSVTIEAAEKWQAKR